MLIRIRSLGFGFEALKTVEHNGQTMMAGSQLGELYKVPDEVREDGERLVGEFSAGMPTLGLIAFDVQLDPPRDDLNGFWVQKEIFQALTKKAVSA
jgi:hypothetical protein